MPDSAGEAVVVWLLEAMTFKYCHWVNLVMCSIRERVEHPGIHLVEALLNFLPKAIQLGFSKIEALSDFFEALSDFFEALSDFFEALSDFFEALVDFCFEMLKLLLYLCESMIHRMIASTILVLFPLKFASDELALLLEFSPKMTVLSSL
jgi:hypothetical protein